MFRSGGTCRNLLEAGVQQVEDFDSDLREETPTAVRTKIGDPKSVVTAGTLSQSEGTGSAGVLNWDQTLPNTQGAFSTSSPALHLLSYNPLYRISSMRCKWWSIAESMSMEESS
jgi:hypothetical protein